MSREGLSVPRIPFVFQVFFGFAGLGPQVFYDGIIVVGPVKSVEEGEGDLVSGEADVEFLAGFEVYLTTDEFGDDDLVFGADEDLGHT